MNWKSFTLIALVLVALAIVVSAQQQWPRNNEFENVDLDSILRNPRLVRRAIDCVLDRGRCDRRANELKGMIPRALNGNCRECSPKQRENMNRITNFMQANHLNEWNMIKAKYSYQG